jgi:hypothetical protein
MALNSKVALMARAYIWFNRLLGLTLGGVSIDSENKFFVNKYLKYYGFLCSIVATLCNIIGFFIFSTSDQILATYRSGQVMTYWAVVLTNLSLIFQIMVNLWYLNLNGTKFMEIFIHYNSNIRKNQIIIFIIWICHIIIPFVGIFYGLWASDMTQISSPIFAIAISVFRVVSFYGVWAVSFLLWTTSIHFFEFLKEIKQSLIEKLSSNNTGIYFS